MHVFHVIEIYSYCAAYFFFLEKKFYWEEYMRDFFLIWEMYEIVKLGQLQYWKCRFTSLFSSALQK